MYHIKPTTTRSPPTASLPRGWWWLVFWLLAVVGDVQGRTEEVSFSSDDRLIVVGRPFACANGSLDLDLALHRDGPDQDEPFVVAVFAWDVWKVISLQRRYYNSLCIAPAVLRFAVQRDLHLKREPLINSLGHVQRYQVAVVNCGGDHVSAKGSLKWIGDDGAQLSFEEQPMLSLSLGLALTYLLTALLWTAYFFLLAPPGLVYDRLLLCAMWSRTVANALLFAQYRIYAESDAFDMPLLWAARLLVEVVGEMSVLTILFSMVFGLGVLRPRLSSRQRPFFWGCWLVYCLVALAYRFGSGWSATMDVVLLVLWLVVRVLVTVIPSIFVVAITFVAHASYFQTAALPLYPHTRLQLLRSLRGLMFLYMPVPVVVTILQYAALGWENEWLVEVAEPCVCLVLMHAIGYTLARHPLHLNFHRTNSNEAPTERADDRGEGAEGEEEDDDDDRLVRRARRQRRRQMSEGDGEEDGAVELTTWRDSSENVEHSEGLSEQQQQHRQDDRGITRHDDENYDDDIDENEADESEAAPLIRRRLATGDKGKEKLPDNEGEETLP